MLQWMVIWVHPHTGMLMQEHSKMLNHFVHICHRCGMQSMGDWSLSNDLSTSLGLDHTPRFCKGEPICPSTEYQDAKTLCLHMIWMWDASCVGLETWP